MKSHRDINEASDFLDAWKIVGNALADELAETALKFDAPEAQSSLQLLLPTVNDKYRRLHEVFTYFLQLDQWRVDNAQNPNHNQNEDAGGDPSTTARTTPTFADALKYLIPSAPNEVIFDLLSSDVANCLPVGQEFAHSVWAWMHTITWPSNIG